MSPSGDSVGWEPSTSTPRRRGTPTFRRERPSARRPAPAGILARPVVSWHVSGGRATSARPASRCPLSSRRRRPPTADQGKAPRPGDGERLERWENRFASYKTMFLEPMAEARRAQLRRRPPRRRRGGGGCGCQPRMRERRPRPASVGNLALDLAARSRKRCYNERIHTTGDYHSGGFLLASSPSVGSLYVLRSSVLKPLPSLLNLSSCATDCLFTLSMRAYLRESGRWGEGRSGNEP